MSKTSAPFLSKTIASIFVPPKSMPVLNGEMVNVTILKAKLLMIYINNPYSNL